MTPSDRAQSVQAGERRLPPEHGVVPARPEIGGGGAKIIDPAPKSFAKPST